MFIQASKDWQLFNWLKRCWLLANNWPYIGKQNQTGKMFYQINRNFVVLEQTIISIKGKITMYVLEMVWCLDMLSD